MRVLGPKDLARRFLPMRGQDVVFAVILTNDIHRVGKPRVALPADVWTKAALRDRARRLVFVKDSDEPFQDRFCEFSFWRVANLIAGTVNNDAGLVAIAAGDIASIDLGAVV